MKNFCIVVLLFLCSRTSFSQATFPAPSPEQTIHQEFGVSAIDVSYSRPSAKERKIFGGLVPFGQAWRTGANGPTVISFGDEVTIGKTKIPAGKYGFVTIPGKDKWILIISKQLNIVSSADYKEENDIVRFESKPLPLEKKIETFTMQFENFSANRCELWLTWDKTAVFLPISIDIDQKVMANIEKAMEGKEPPYFQAAYYYFSNNKNLDKAEHWAQKATELNPDGYYIFYLLAEIQAKKGEKAKALESASKSMELSKQSKRDDYITLNQELIKSLK